MRLLFLIQGHKVEDHIGFHDGCLRLLAEGHLHAYRPLPYFGTAATHGWDGCWEQALRLAREIDANAVFLQHYHGAVPNPTKFIKAVRALPSRPLVAVSSGDSFGYPFCTPHSLRRAASAADITFVTEAGGYARALARHGARRVVLMPTGCCQVRFSRPLDRAAWAPDSDLVFVGNLLSVRNPFRYALPAARRRHALVDALWRRYGKRLAVYGHGWDHLPSARGPIAYGQQHDAMRRSRVVVGGYPGGYHDYYMSDRVPTAISSGIPFIDYHIPRVDRIFRDGEHWFLHRDAAGLLALCDRLLDWSDAERLSFGQRAATMILDHHTHYHKMRDMVKIMADLAAALAAGRTPALPHLDFFLPEVDQVGEARHAVVNWQ